MASDAALRIVVEVGPFILRVLRPDGSTAGAPATLPDRGMALGGITAGGT